MPRVSPEHLEQRRQQIIVAARRCFARNGFHETSMQDVFRESGLSAGAVYRYFKSKNELILAIATEVLDRLNLVFDAVLTEDPVPPIDEVIRRFADAASELSAPDGPARIAPQAWATALYDPAMAEVVRTVLGRFRDQWIAIAERERAAGNLPPDTDLFAVSVVLLALAPGFLLQRLLVGDVEPETFQRGVKDLLRATVRTSS